MTHPERRQLQAKRTANLLKTLLDDMKSPLGSQSLPHFYILLYNRYQDLILRPAADAALTKKAVYCFPNYA